MSEAPAPFSLTIITVSDSASRGERDEDVSGATAAADLAFIDAAPARVVVADDADAIRNSVVSAGGDIVVLTGGTGVGPRDVTPQAVAPLLDYEIPGMAEAMRSIGRQSTPMAMLSRQIAGVRGRTLVLVLPGSPRAVRESLAAVRDVLEHALELLRGDTPH